ncbi:hypothetical protein NIES2109_39200 [Nostoc sp. HK-01]|nr:hypothetical protein NIES2109_39200 [Nostoc sp. HK-01]
MKAATSIVTTTSDDSVIKQQSSTLNNSASNLSQNSLEILEDPDFELERIMFEEFVHGLPSDIPMADW